MIKNARSLEAIYGIVLEKIYNISTHRTYTFF